MYVLYKVISNKKFAIFYLLMTYKRILLIHLSFVFCNCCAAALPLVGVGGLYEVKETKLRWGVNLGLQNLWGLYSGFLFRQDYFNPVLLPSILKLKIYFLENTLFLYAVKLKF